LLVGVLETPLDPLVMAAKSEPLLNLAAMTRGSKGVSNTPTSNFQTKKVN